MNGDGVGFIAEKRARNYCPHDLATRMVLKMRSPNQVKIEKPEKLMQDAGEVRCPKLLRRFTSFDN